MFWINCRHFVAFQAKISPKKQITSYIIRTSLFSTYSGHSRWYFDTLQLVKQLESEGFTKQQSHAVMQALQTVLEERLVVFRALFVIFYAKLTIYIVSAILQKQW